MKLLVASNQQNVYKWIGSVLDDDDDAVLVSIDDLVPQFNADRYDSVIVDIEGVDAQVNDLIAGIRAIATRRWIPIVILSPELGEDRLSSFFKAGADDLVLTSYPSWLMKAKLNALARVEHVQSELQQAMDRIEQLSLVDTITQLPNYRGVINEATRLCGQSRRDRKSFACVLIEVDHFDDYIQESGLQSARALFQTLALLVEGSSGRPLDFVGRYDKTSLILLLPDTDAVGAKRVATAVLQNVREAQLPFLSSPDGIVTASAATQTIQPSKSKILIDERLAELRKELDFAQEEGANETLVV